jgi:hypothetical protein
MVAAIVIVVWVILPMARTLTREPNRVNTMWQVTYKPVDGYVSMSWYLGGGSNPGKERILRSGATTGGSAYVGEVIWVIAVQDRTSPHPVYDLVVTLYVRGKIVKTCQQIEASSICSWTVA